MSDIIVLLEQIVTHGMSSIGQNTLTNVLIWDSYLYFKIYFLKNYK